MPHFTVPQHITRMLNDIVFHASDLVVPPCSDGGLHHMNVNHGERDPKRFGVVELIVSKPIE